MGSWRLKCLSIFYRIICPQATAFCPSSPLPAVFCCPILTSSAYVVRTVKEAFTVSLSCVNKDGHLHDQGQILLAIYHGRWWHDIMVNPLFRKLLICTLANRKCGLNSLIIELNSLVEPNVGIGDVILVSNWGFTYASFFIQLVRLV